MALGRSSPDRGEAMPESTVAPQARATLAKIESITDERTIADVCDVLQRKISERAGAPPGLPVRRVVGVLETLARGGFGVPVARLRSSFAAPRVAVDAALLLAECLGLIRLIEAALNAPKAERAACVNKRGRAFAGCWTASPMTRHRLRRNVIRLLNEAARHGNPVEVFRAVEQAIDVAMRAPTEMPMTNADQALGAIKAWNERKGMLPGVPLPLVRAELPDEPRVCLDRRLLELEDQGRIVLVPLGKAAAFADHLAAIPGEPPGYYCCLTRRA